MSVKIGVLILITFLFCGAQAQASPLCNTSFFDIGTTDSQPLKLV